MSWAHMDETKARYQKRKSEPIMGGAPTGLGGGTEALSPNAGNSPKHPRLETDSPDQNAQKAAVSELQAKTSGLLQQILVGQVSLESMRTEMNKSPAILSVDTNNQSLISNIRKQLSPSRVTELPSNSPQSSPTSAPSIITKPSPISRLISAELLKANPGIIAGLTNTSIITGASGLLRNNGTNSISSANTTSGQNTTEQTSPVVAFQPVQETENKTSVFKEEPVPLKFV